MTVQSENILRVIVSVALLAMMTWLLGIKFMLVFVALAIGMPVLGCAFYWILGGVSFAKKK